MKKTKKTITADKLDKLKYPTLEDILAVLNGGKYEKFFLSRPKIDADGHTEDLTAKGAKVYEKLTSILYACARLTGGEVENIVEELDTITTMYL